ncbi:hypothetical protein ACHAWF_003998 [Thalassiosira exigua]
MKWKRPSFLAVKTAQLLCVVYILVLTFSFAPLGLRDPATKNIIDVGSPQNTEDGVILVNGDYRPVVARGTYELVCLGMSRMSAFSLYPVMVLAYLTKCKATLNCLEKTPLSMFKQMDDHKLHVYCGRFIAVDVWIHTLFHLLRWAHQGNLELLWTSRAGLSGLIAVVATPLISFFMMSCKTYISYEIRKGLHYLFFLFVTALCFHVPPSGIPNGGFIAYVLGASIVLYALDSLYVLFFMTERVDPTFRVMPSGVQMTMRVSPRFRRCGEKGGFGYVCLPWLETGAKQWHAFSLFQDPSDPSIRSVFMLNVGDWTDAVQTELERNDTSRPVWIQGPFVSPYTIARNFDNLILTSTGIGITPALSVIEAHKKSRTIFVIWATRDSSLIEFFLENYHYLDHENGFVFIHYTGDAPLDPALLEGLASNVKVLYSRPNLEAVIPNIIHASESSGMKSQQQFEACSKCQVISNLLERSKEFDTEIYPYSDETKLQDLTAMSREAGYDLSELSDHFRDAAIACPFAAAAGAKEGSRARVAPQLPSTECAISSENAPVVFKRIRHYANAWGPTLHATRSIKKMDHRSISRWGMMYCGGASEVKGTLKKISKEFGIDLHHESFAW